MCKLIKDLIHQKGITIDITNACINQCGNCMRFCGHHKNTYYMDLDYFKKVIDSLHDFDGQIGIIGGEPTLHPQFKEMIQYIKDTYPYTRIKKGFRNPVKDINSYIFNTNVDDIGKFKLFTTASTQQFYDNFELIDDVFESFRFNDHSEKTKHFTVLANYKDLGITDEEFDAMENLCWVQKYCFASVTHKGGFFCEMAGTLDTLYDGDGGFPIEDGWWKKYRKDYGKQLEWCKKCGARLGLPMQNDFEHQDLITESITKELDTERINKNQYRIVTKDDYEKNHFFWQREKEKKLNIVDEICVSNTNKFLRPQQIDFINDVNDVFSCSDWVVVGAPNNMKDVIRSYIKERTFNLGCLYNKDGVLVLNVKAQALQGLTSIDKNIWGYYDLDKIVTINDDDDKIIQSVQKKVGIRNNSRELAEQKAKITKELKRNQ